MTINLYSFASVIICYGHEVPCGQDEEEVQTKSVMGERAQEAFLSIEMTEEVSSVALTVNKVFCLTTANCTLADVGRANDVVHAAVFK